MKKKVGKCCESKIKEHLICPPLVLHHQFQTIVPSELKNGHVNNFWHFWLFLHRQLVKRHEQTLNLEVWELSAPKSKAGPPSSTILQSPFAIHIFVRTLLLRRRLKKEISLNSESVSSNKLSQKMLLQPLGQHEAHFVLHVISS